MPEPRFIINKNTTHYEETTRDIYFFSLDDMPPESRKKCDRRLAKCFRDQGMSYREIADRLLVSPSTARRWATVD